MKTQIVYYEKKLCVITMFYVCSVADFISEAYRLLNVRLSIFSKNQISYIISNVIHRGKTLMLCTCEYNNNEVKE